MSQNNELKLLVHISLTLKYPINIKAKAKNLNKLFGLYYRCCMLKANNVNHCKAAQYVHRFNHDRPKMQKWPTMDSETEVVQYTLYLKIKRCLLKNRSVCSLKSSSKTILKSRRNMENNLNGLNNMIH